MTHPPATLEGEHVRLEPLSLEKHWEALSRVGLDPDLWKLTIARVETTADLRAYLETALQEQAEGRSVPYATVHKPTGHAVGSTRFGAIDRQNRRVEIGWTWIAPPWQRTVVNTEAKLLMFTHAFEVWGCLRVELKTDKLNLRSQNAMRRIGCTEEGTFRKHQIAGSGRVRDSVYFSVIDDEWPTVKAGLRALLDRPR
jgi:RimJ/RimL family protein N-acetyltransferase